MAIIPKKETGAGAARRRGRVARFAFSGAAVRAFRELPVSLVVDHSGERGHTPLSEETKAALFEDLIG